MQQKSFIKVCVFDFVIIKMVGTWLTSKNQWQEDTTIFSSARDAMLKTNPLQESHHNAENAVHRD